MPPEFVTVGWLGRTRGVEGEIYVTPDTAFPERFIGLREIYVRNCGVWEVLKIASSRMIAGRPVLRFEDIFTPEEAACLTNRELGVPKAEVVKLPEDHYYLFELVGCKIVEEGSGRLVGEVTDVEQYPANDIYVIKTSTGKRLLLPAIRQFVKEIDIEKQRIVADPVSFIDDG